jgi:hypothetical protein
LATRLLNDDVLARFDERAPVYESSARNGVNPRLLG